MTTHKADATAVLVQERNTVSPELVKRLNELEASLSYVEFEMNRNIVLRGYHYPTWRRSFVKSVFPVGRYSK